MLAAFARILDGYSARRLLLLDVPSYYDKHNRE